MSQCICITVEAIATQIFTILQWPACFQQRNQKERKQHSLTMLCSSSIALAVFCITFKYYLDIPTIRQSWPLCWNNMSLNYAMMPEEYNCIVTQSSVNSAITLW